MQKKKKEKQKEKDKQPKEKEPEMEKQPEMEETDSATLNPVSIPDVSSPKNNKNKHEDNQIVAPLFTGIEELLTLEPGLVIARVGLDELREQDKNARVMSREKFDQLTANIRNRGTLESLPLCARTKRGIEVISGHHRIRAARQAGMTHVYILLDTSGLTRDAIVSKQLAHNSLQGIDDKELVKQLFMEIQDINAQLETGLDPKDLEIAAPEKISIPDLNLGFDMKHISFMFLPHQLDNFKEVVEHISNGADFIGVADLEYFPKFREAVTAVQKVEDIRAVGTILSKMCDIVLEHYRPIQAQLEEDKKIKPGEIVI